MASTQRDSFGKAHAQASPKYQAENLAKTRRDNANEIAEDYVEAIADLIAETGEARVVDLAKRLGGYLIVVSNETVPGACKVNVRVAPK